jgi:hypothetical protein
MKTGTSATDSEGRSANPPGRELSRRLNESDGLVGREQWVVFFLAAAAVAIREPDLLLNPQFYAEGGAWYAEAYNLGWAHALLIPAGGYPQLFSRLVAALCLLAPLQFAPLLMNLCGIACQALPVCILLSPRCSRWGPLPVRLLMAGVYVALPNAGEIHVVLASVQWHLGFAACLLVLGNPPATWRGKVFDSVVLILCGLTGPFCVLLLPLAGIFWWKRRQSWSGIVLGVLAVASVLTGLALVSGGWQGRVAGALGASPDLFARILAGQVYLAALVGQNDFASHANVVVIVAADLIGTLVIGWSLLRGRWELRLFIAFSAMLLAAALKNPVGGAQQLQWEFLATSTGGRYWFFPMLAVSWSLIWCATQSAFKPFQVLGVSCLAVMLWGELHELKYAPFPDEQFPRHAREFAAARPGTALTIPICPEGWSIRLVKK